MVLIAVKYISDVIGIEKIFRNMIISVLFAVGAIVVGTLTVLGAVLRVMEMGVTAPGLMRVNEK